MNSKPKYVPPLLHKVEDALGPFFVPFRGKLAKIYGVNEALVLSQLIYWSERGFDPNGWIYKESKEWEEETGLSYKQQFKARKELKQLNVIEEVLKKRKQKIFFRVKWEVLLQALEALNAQTEGGDMRTLPNGSSSNDQTAGPPAQTGDPSTESTQEITSEKKREKQGSSEEDQFSSSFSSISSHSNSVNANSKDYYFPEFKSPEFPRLPDSNNGDWIAAVKRFDPGADTLTALFPGCSWSMSLAHEYYTRRRTGDITLRHINLLGRFFHTTRCRERPDWKPTSLQQLITRFPEVVETVERHVRGHLEEINEKIRELEDEDLPHAESELSRTLETIRRTADIEGLKKFLRDSVGPRLWWPMLTALALRGAFVKLSEEQRKEALAQLTEEPAAVSVISTRGVDFHATFGFTSEDVSEERTRKVYLLNRNRDVMRQCLGISDSDEKVVTQSPSEDPGCDVTKCSYPDQYS